MTRDEAAERFLEAMEDLIDCGFEHRATFKARAREALSELLSRLAPTPEAVHQAMQSAPHDGLPYRQARAAIKAVLP